MNYAGVAISGKAGAGKDTLANELGAVLAQRGTWASRIGFSDALKEDVLRIWGLTKEDPGGRDRLVEYGLAARREDPDVWVSRLAQKVDSLSPHGFFPIVADLRYANEHAWARDVGYLLVRIDTLRLDRMAVLARRGEDPDFADSDLESEVALDDAEFDVRVWNPHNGMAGQAFLHRIAVDIADRLDASTEAWTPKLKPALPGWREIARRRPRRRKPVRG